MKKVCLVFLCLYLTVNSFAAPLIFKAKKDVDSLTDFVEITTLDVSKYKKIRVTVERHTPIKENNLSEAFSVSGVENSETTEIIRERIVERSSIVLEVIPDKIKIGIIGQGTFSVYVWGIN